MISDQSDKAQSLDLALSQIERQFGRGSLMRLGAAGAVAEVAVIPTGSLALDAALGVGDRKSTRLNSSHLVISYAVFCLKKKNKKKTPTHTYVVSGINSTCSYRVLVR